MAPERCSNWPLAADPVTLCLGVLGLQARLFALCVLVSRLVSETWTIVSSLREPPVSTALCLQRKPPSAARPRFKIFPRQPPPKRKLHHLQSHFRGEDEQARQTGENSACEQTPKFSARLCSSPLSSHWKYLDLPRRQISPASANSESLAFCP